MSNKPRVYLDLDGVMADFDTAFFQQHGVRPKTLHDDVLWPKVYENPTFFADLPMCDGAASFYDWLRLWDQKPIILTACPKTKYEPVALQKKEWVRRNLGSDLTVLPVMGGRNKWLFMHAKGDILIDDFKKNLNPWIDAGGVGILHEGDFEATKSALRSILVKEWSNA